MKLDFAWQDDGNVHVYCVGCHSQEVERHRVDGRAQYFCTSCQKDYDRWIKIDPAIVWRVAKDGTYWHESAGIFVRNPDDKFLFFQRGVFPFALTVPAGHIDAGEDAETAAHRELMEEVGIGGELRLIDAKEMPGDACSRGSDDHVWSAYLMITPQAALAIDVNEEGHSAVWLTLDEALDASLTLPVEYYIRHYRKALLA